MNDNDIIKALECCKIKKPPYKCEECPLLRGTSNSCLYECKELAYDLIIRQIAEIVKLLKENDELKDGYFQKRYEETEHQELMGLREAWRKSTDQNMDLQLEIEGLQKDLGIWKDIAARETSYVSIVKTEAIKELADRLCDGRVSNDPVVIAVKCTVKEMTEEPKE